MKRSRHLFLCDLSRRSGRKEIYDVERQSSQRLKYEKLPLCLCMRTRALLTREESFELLQDKPGFDTRWQN